MSKTVIAEGDYPFQLEVDGKDGWGRVLHPGSVVVVAVEGDRIYLAAQQRRTVGKRLLELPAGTRDVQNESTQETARRELLEELGIAAREWKYLTGFYSSPGFLTEWIDMYRATALSVVAEPEEGIERVSFTLSEALQEIQTGRIICAKTQLGILHEVWSRVKGLVS